MITVSSKVHVFSFGEKDCWFDSNLARKMCSEADRMCYYETLVSL